MADAMEARVVKFEQNAELYNFGQPSHSRMNTWDAATPTPSVKGKIITINYRIGWYGAGAAHPNYHFRTFCFFLDPLIRIKSLNECFGDADSALTLLKQVARQQLIAEITAGVDADTDMEFLTDWIRTGTDDWDCFNSFVFKAEALELYFSPYQVAPYAAGSQFVSVSYDAIKELLKPHYKSALEIY
jgi:hypothetical protein